MQRHLFRHGALAVTLVAASAAFFASTGYASDPSFTMTDNFGDVWSVSTTSSTAARTVDFAGTVTTDGSGCGTYSVTGSVTGKSDWTFVAKNPSPPEGCVNSVTLMGDGYPSISGTWRNSAGNTGTWTGQITSSSGGGGSSATGSSSPFRS